MKTHLSKDISLIPLIEKIVLPESKKVVDLYFTLLESIVSQQLSVKASDTIFKRFLALFENNYPHPEAVISCDIEKLRSVGLSRQKADYIKNVALFSIESGLKMEQLETMADEELLKYLTQIKGVGKWTVEMLMMFALNREDVFPVDDIGIQHAMIKLYALEEKGKELKKKMTEIAENWKPYRTMACRYLWRYKDSG